MQIISKTLTYTFAQRKLCNLHWCRLLVVQLMSLKFTSLTLNEMSCWDESTNITCFAMKIWYLSLFFELWFVLNLYVFYPTLSKEVISKLPRSGFRNSLEDTGVLDKYKNGLDVGVDMQGVYPTLDETTLIHANFIQSPKIV